MDYKCKVGTVGVSEPGKPDSESVCGKAIDENEHSFSWEKTTCPDCRAVRAQYVEETLRGPVDAQTGAVLGVAETPTGRVFHNTLAIQPLRKE